MAAIAAVMGLAIVAVGNLGPQSGALRMGSLAPGHRPFRRGRRRAAPGLPGVARPLGADAAGGLRRRGVARLVDAPRAAGDAADGGGRAAPRRGAQPGGPAPRRARRAGVRARHGRGASAGAAGTDRAALPVQCAGQRASALPDRPRCRPRDARHPDAGPRCRLAAHARGALLRRPRAGAGRGLPGRAASPHGAPAELRRRRAVAAARTRPAADDAADDGRERRQARTRTVHRGRHDPHLRPPRRRHAAVETLPVSDACAWRFRQM